MGHEKLLQSRSAPQTGPLAGQQARQAMYPGSTYRFLLLLEIPPMSLGNPRPPQGFNTGVALSSSPSHRAFRRASPAGTTVPAAAAAESRRV